MFSAILSIVVLSFDVIGFDDDVAPSWCWIDPDIENQVMWQYIAGKLWEILAFLTILVLYGLIKYSLRRHVRILGFLSINLISLRSGCTSDRVCFFCSSGACAQCRFPAREALSTQAPAHRRTIARRASSWRRTGS